MTKVFTRQYLTTTNWNGKNLAVVSVELNALITKFGDSVVLEITGDEDSAQVSVFRLAFETDAQYTRRLDEERQKQEMFETLERKTLAHLLNKYKP